MDVAFEDVRAATAEDSFAMMMRESIDTIKREIASTLDDYTTASDIDDGMNSGGAVFCNEDVEDTLLLITSSSKVHVDIFWPVDNQYYSGEATRVQNGKHQATYDEGDTEVFDMSQKTWHFWPTGSKACTVSTSCAI